MMACMICGAEFYGKSSPSGIDKGAHKYCSRKCKGIASRCKPRPCETCGKTFQPTYNTSKRFCSAECRYAARKTGATVPCEICGTHIYIPAVRLAISKHYFCCVQHLNKWQARTKVEYTCRICGKPFRWSPSRSRQNEVKYCSLACRNRDPEVAQRLRTMNLRQQERKINRLERDGYALLNALGIEYQPQHLIGGKFCVDAFVPVANTIIQFDGDYWHGNPIQFPAPDARQTRRMILDKSQDAYMAACGYSVIRIWESDLRHNIETVKARLLPLRVPA